jgi:hypothetical protein
MAIGEVTKPFQVSQLQPGCIYRIETKAWTSPQGLHMPAKTVTRRFLGVFQLVGGEKYLDVARADGALHGIAIGLVLAATATAFSYRD